MSIQIIQILSPIRPPKLAGPTRPELLKFYDEWKEYLRECECQGVKAARLKACVSKSLLRPISFVMKRLIPSLAPCLVPRQYLLV